MSKEIRAATSYYRKLIPVCGWSKTMTKTSLAVEVANTSRSSILLRFANKKNNIEPHWRYLDAAGVTRDEYIDAVNTLGFDSVRYITEYYAHDQRKTKIYVELHLDFVRSSHPPKNSSLTIILQLLNTNDPDDGYSIRDGIDVVLESEIHWETIYLIGLKAYTELSALNISLEDMKLMCDKGIDYNIISALNQYQP